MHLNNNKHEAFKKRDLLDIKQREQNYYDFLKLKNSYKKTKKSLENTYLLYPAFENLQDLDEILHKLSFALPNTNNISILAVLHKNFVLDTNDYKKYKNIKFIKDNQIDINIQDNTILIHSMSKVKDISLFQNSRNIEIIDKNYFLDVESTTLATLFFNFLDNNSKKKYEKLSQENFRKFKLKNISKKQAFCFTSGPSFDSYKSFNFPKNSLNIICNSIVSNTKFLKYIKNVDLITFSDPTFYFSSSQYSVKFREDLLKVIENSDTYIAVPQKNVPLLVFHYPKIENRVIGIKMSFNYNFPNLGNLYVKSNGNILTQYMIPIASSLCDTIFIMGADGRKANENYFWKHSKNAQYSQLMESVFLFHPSCFRDRVYSDYYTKHCEDLEKLILYGESLGKVYFSITKSYIKALAKRYINFNISKKKLKKNIKSTKTENLKSIDLSTLLSNYEVNFDFSIKINRLFSYINSLKNSKDKIAIYGNGLVGNLIAKELKDNLVVICDNNPNNSKSDFAKVCLPQELKNYSFDYLVICVLGREKQILESLEKFKISKDKILTINLSENGILDKNSKEFLENNLVGPFTRESNLTLDEINIVFNYINKYKNDGGGEL